MKDAQDNHVLTVRGPLLICDGPLSCRCENKFTVNEMLEWIFVNMYLIDR